MIRFYIILMIFSIINFMPLKIQADHLMGAEITWDCIGQDSFEVQLSIYRSCQGSKLDTPTLQVNCKAGGTLNNINKTLKSVDSVKDITPTGKNCCSQCDSSGCNFQYGIEAHKYRYFVDFSNSSCCKVGFAYTGSSRRKTSTGVSGDLYVESWMNRCKASCNNSPNFDNYPIDILCKDQKVIDNHGAYDNDKNQSGNLQDSLSYSFSKPLNGSGNPVSYNSPYSFKKPLACKGSSPTLPFPFGFHLDEVTGDIKFTPTKKQTSAMALSVDEYRDTNNDGIHDIQIGKVTRDYQVIVLKCPVNKCPDIVGMNCPQEDYYQNICAGYQHEFTFCPQDKNTNDTLTIGFNRGNLPDSASWAIKDSNQRVPKGELKWTPQASDVDKIPYQFTVSVRDDNCPVNCEAVNSYRIQVNPEISASYQLKELACSHYQLSASTQKGNSLSFKWQIDGQTYQKDSVYKHQFRDTGLYPFSLFVSNNQCKREYQDTILVDSLLRIDIGNDTTICQGDTLILGGKAKDGKGKITYTWHDSVQGRQKRTFGPLNRDTLIHLTVTDSSGCTYKDSVQVTVSSFEKTKRFPDTTICLNNDSITLDAGSRGEKFLWYDSTQKAQKTIRESGTYHISITDQYGCTTKDTFKISKTPDTVLKPFVEGCKGDSILLNAGKPDNKQFIWGSGDQGSRKWVDTGGLYTVKTKDSLHGCQAFDTTQVKFYALPSLRLRPDTSLCRGDSIALNPSHDSGSFQRLKWQDSFSQTHRYVGEGREYIATLTDTNGCQKIDTFGLNIYDLPRPNLGRDSQICQGDTIKVQPGQNFAGYRWEDGDTTSFKYFNGNDTGILKVTDSVGCSYPDTFMSSKSSKPNIGLGPDTTICQQDSILLNTKVGSGKQVEWHTGDTITSRWVDSSGTYRVKVENNSGCVSRDSIAIKVLTNCVWPGDANNDGVVNHLDILPLGIKYGANGPARPEIGVNWQSYQAPKWNDTFINGLSTKYADCDGNGIINTGDLVAISENYRITGKSDTFPNKVRPNAPPLDLEIMNENLNPGDTVRIALNVGKTSNPISNFYGYATDVKLKGDGFYRVPEHEMALGWFRTGLFITEFLKDENKFEVSGSLTNQQGIDGSGHIAELTVGVAKHVSTKDSTFIKATVPRALLTDPQGRPIAFSNQAVDSMLVKSQSSGTSSAEEGIEVFPNPASDLLMIEVKGNHPNLVSIRNIRGQLVKRQNIQKGLNHLSVEELPAGLYQIRIQMKEKVLTKKVVIH